MATSAVNERFNPAFRAVGAPLERPATQAPFSGQVGVLLIHIGGDIGGAGICKLHAFNADGTPFSTLDATTFANAGMAMWNGVKALLPPDVTITCDGVLEHIDMNTGVVGVATAISPLPPAVTGTDVGGYGAGLGARGYWHTITVRGRRRVRGATYLVPLGANAWAASGALTSTSAAACAQAMGNYANAMISAGFFPGVWCRPNDSLKTNGILATITSWSVGVVPGGLRSRRS